MNQPFSVLGLLFSILILAKNSSTAALNNNVLQSKPMNMDNNHSTTKTKTIFLKKKFINFNRTKNLNALNSTRLNSIVPVMSLVSSSQTNRFPRHVQKNIDYKNNNEDAEYKRYIKVILDLQPDNYEDMYDYYDDGKYNVNRVEKINSLIDELNLRREIERNSKPITRNLNESQERKRCTKKITQNLGSINHQQSQDLLLRDIEDGIESTIKCMNCEVLKSNTNQGEPKDNYDSNLQFKQPTLLENRLDETPNTNSSSKKEIMVKFEKIKGNRITNKLDSSPENTFVNGNRDGNKTTGNKVNDFKPIVNDNRSALNDTNELISKNDTNEFYLKDSNNQVIETNDNISNNKLNNLSVVTIQEKKNISTSPLSGENGHILFSKETLEPVVVSSTSNYKSNPSMIHDNYKLKLTTKQYTDQFNREENDSGYENNNKNQDNQFEPTINNFPATAILESNKKSTSDLNDALKIKYSYSTAESNITKKGNNPKTNYSDSKTAVEDSILDEKEYNSLDGNVNCTCNKKIKNNILSSKMMKNITDVKTDTNISLNSLKMNGHKLSEKSLRKNDEYNMARNSTSGENVIKNKNNLNSDLLGKKQITYKSTSKNNLKESNENLLQESMLNNEDNQSQHRTQDSRKNKNTDIVSNSSLFKFRIPELKLKGQRKRNNDEDIINDLEEINKKKMSSVPKNLPQNNSRQFVTQLKRFPQKDETSTRNNYRENNNNIGKTTTNKSSTQMLNKALSRTPLQTIPEISSKQKENITKKAPRELVEKIKQNSNIRTASNLGDDNNDIASTKKRIASPTILSQVPKQKINNHSPETKVRILENDDVNVTTNSPKKLIAKSDKHILFNPNTRIVKGFKENNNLKKISSRKDSINTNNSDLVKLQKPSSLVETIESSKIQMTPKNKIVNIYSTKIPTTGRSINNRIIGNKNFLKSKISKPAHLISTPKTLSSSNPTVPIKNSNMSILKLNKSLNNAKIKTSSVPLFLDKIPKTKYRHSDKPLTLALKNKNALNDQSPIERGSIKKIDTKPNLKFLDDADSKVMLESYLPEQSQVEDPYDHEHAPYTNENLEPIIFDGPTQKPKMLNKSSQFVVQSPISRQSSNRNRKHNKLDVKLSQPAPINRPEYDENDDSQRNSKFEVNVKNQKYQPAFNTSNNVPISSDMTDNDEYDAKSSKDESLNPNRFEVISQAKITDGVFKIPLVSHTSVDNNGTEYVSDIFIPIEKPDGRHSAISLTKLLTGDFKLLNDHEVEHLSSVKPTHEMDPKLSSTRTPTVCERSDVIDDPINSNLLKILQATKHNEKLTAPIHVIQIINNGQCSYKHNGNDTAQKSVHDNGEQTFNKFRNEGRRLSSIRSQNTPDNNKQINRKIVNAYNHFDSAILDRFLQVYSPHLV